MTRWLMFSIGLTLLAFAGTLYLYEFHFDQLPEQVPVHWNIEGEPNRWVERSDLLFNFLLTPCIMVFFVILTAVLPWLSPRNFNIETFRPTYDYLMTVVVVMMGFIQCLILYASYRPGLDTARFLVAGLMLFFALIGNVLGKVRRNFYVGVKTPWTLASEVVWNRTHRVTAWLWTSYGLVAFIALLAGLPILWSLPGLLIIALGPVFYSLWLYKSLEKQGKLESQNQEVPVA
jgi:uncharacterized membrane protein